MAKNGDDEMSLSRDELLRPSLQDAAVPKAPYSVQTVLLTAFIGGPLAAIAITALNSARLRRLRDVIPLSVALIAYLGLMLVLMDGEWGTDFRDSLTELAGARGMNYFQRLIALALFGLGYLLHRREQRSADVMGLNRPNGYIGGIACIAGSAFASLAFGLRLVI
jgi:hypothetical protein